MNQLTYYHSPVGHISIEATENAITKIHFIDNLTGNFTGNLVNNSIENSKIIDTELANKSSEVIQKCVQELDLYFAGKLQQFTVPLQTQGTDFQKVVWAELQNIPFGKTISYLELARRLGNEKVIRAAGTANGKNPIAIIIPCHRVIGSDGTLVGYAGGLWRKKHLLDLENALPKGIFD